MADDLLLEGRILESTRDRAKQEVVIDLIAEGFGNPRDGHYYSRSLLEASSAVFDGALQYVDHLDADAARKLNGLPRSVRDLGGRIIETAFLAPGESHPSLGTNERPVSVLRGRSKIAQPWLWQMVEADPDLLGVSIHAGGNSKAGQVEGRQAKIVEAITRVGSVDWVTQAGAGGKVVGLIEAQIEAEVSDPPPETPPETPPVEPETPPEPIPPATPPETPEPETPEPPATPPPEEETTREAELAASHIDTLIDAIGDPAEVYEGAVRGLALEPIDGETLPDDVLEAWTLWSAFVKESPEDARALIEEWGPTEVEPEVVSLDGDIEARAIELAQEKLNEAVRLATEGMREHYEEKLTEAKAEADRRVAEVEERYQRSLRQLDQRHLAAQIIEQAGFKPPTERALKEQFFDAYFESDDVLRHEVEEAIKSRKAELAAYQERRVTGVPESNGSSLTEAGVAPGERPKRAPLDEQIDREIGIES